MPRTRHAVWFWAFALLLGEAGAPGADERRFVSISATEGRLSLTTRDTPLMEVLSQIAHATGIVVHVDPGSGQAVVMQESTTVVFENLAIEEALERLLRHSDYTLLYSTAGLAEVRIYGRRSADSRAPPASPRVAPRQTEAARTRSDSSASTGAAPATLTTLREAALANPNPSVRLDALLRISEFHPPAATLDTALHVLAVERDPTVLLGVLDVLGELDTTPIEALLDFVRRSQQHGPRIRALEVLGERAGDDARLVELLRTASAGDHSPEVRENARALLRKASEQ